MDCVHEPTGSDYRKGDLDSKSSDRREELERSVKPAGPKSWGTAFRDGVHEGMKLLDDVLMGAQRPKWIIALTDGEDNKSKTSTEDLCGQLKQGGCSLITIGVGMREKHQHTDRRAHCFLHRS